MPLTVGDRYAGHFDVTGVLGAGGMGEVYRCHDNRLNRDVALKILPNLFAGDPARLARFQREAELLASLNHPNIAQIHGIEEDGGTRALVLELVDGLTLEERIARGPIPLDEALAIANQIADALEAAHEAGVIHRDLKPANVKIRDDGTVKVLDFGVAKGLDTLAVSSDLHDSPTMTVSGTQLGVIVGTAAYMSPEQARGRAVDKRTDIWAFGAVLYEMLTGRKAFEGDHVTGILAEVIKSEPAWEALSGDVVPAVSGVLRWCLEKDPRERMRDIGDVRLVLRRAFDDSDHRGDMAPPVRVPGWRRRAVELAAVGLLGAIVAGLGIRTLQPFAPASRRPVRFTITATPNMGPFVEMSPDGRRLAYLESDENALPRLWVHSLESGEARQLSSAGVVGSPLFWSPDSRSIGFSDGSTLRRIDVATGVVDPVGDTASMNGASWNGDDVIVFAGRSGIMQVSAAGGTTTPLTTVDETRGEIRHAAPWFLPDGRHFLYLRTGSDSSAGGIYVGALGVSPDAQAAGRLVATDRVAVFAPSSGSASTGHLLFLRSGRLLAQPFDVARLEVAGDPVVVAEAVGSFDVWGSFSVSRTGVIAYRGMNAASSVLWTDPAGRDVAAGQIPGLEDPANPRLSPDGSRLALAVAGDIWVFDLEGRPPVKLTFDEFTNATPLWTPDGERIVYEGDGALYWVLADGGSSPEPIGPPGHFHAHAWTPDGDLIAVSLSRAGGDLVVLSPRSDEEPRAIVQTPADEGLAATLSPDGRWLAYNSDPTGQQEIWVRPYPGPGAPLRISPRGGWEPVWAKDGRTLFYLEGRAMMEVAIDTSAGFDFGAPVRLFDRRVPIGGQPPSYDVAADGRFVTIGADAIPAVSVILDWPELLRSRGGDD